MKPQTLDLELITRAFVGGMDNSTKAEIRVPSIRGQLRWWFRVLGGIPSPSSKAPAIEDQEAQIFGSAAGEQGNASKLMIRVLPINRILPQGTRVMGKAGVPNDETYLLWPMAQKRKDDDGIERENIRAYLAAGTIFKLQLDWRGDPALWTHLLALATVFGNLGALGYRGRRAQGALGFAGHSPLSLQEALKHFPAHPTRLLIRELGTGKNAQDVVRQLAAWLKKWREHGQQDRYWTRHDRKNHSLGGLWTATATPATSKQPGFPYARRDHNEGLRELTGSYPSTDPVAPEGVIGTTFRPALGLPIGQFFSSLGTGRGPLPRPKATVNWTRTGDGEGRFASPIILRPHRINSADWRALILFVDCLRWNPSDKVFLNGKPKNVSLELYNQMKASAPTPFP
jgi:CRISPR type III-B/RAMP module RAMP protein Cmr1